MELPAQAEMPEGAIDLLAAEIHKVYCKYYRAVRGEEYWTKGDYVLLDNKTKAADRYLARFILKNFVRRAAEEG